MSIEVVSTNPPSWLVEKTPTVSIRTLFTNILGRYRPTEKCLVGSAIMYSMKNTTTEYQEVCCKVNIDDNSRRSLYIVLTTSSLFLTRNSPTTISKRSLNKASIGGPMLRQRQFNSATQSECKCVSKKSGLSASNYWRDCSIISKVGSHILVTLAISRAILYIHEYVTGHLLAPNEGKLMSHNRQLKTRSCSMRMLIWRIPNHLPSSSMIRSRWTAFELPSNIQWHGGTWGCVGRHTWLWHWWRLQESEEPKESSSNSEKKETENMLVQAFTTFLWISLLMARGILIGDFISLLVA